LSASENMNFNFLKPKRIFWLSIFSASIVIFPLPSLALRVEDVPNPRQVSGDWVTDMAGILSEDAQAQINQMISDLEAKNGTEITVVTVPTTSPAPSPKSFATALFNHWGIGKQGEDNGVLFLISVGDRRVEIETGYGIEAILPDARVGNIITSEIIPEFKQGDFAAGTLAGTRALVVVLGSDSQPTRLFTRGIKSIVDGFVLLLKELALLLALLAPFAPVIVFFFLNKLYIEIFGKIYLDSGGQTRRKQGHYAFCCIECQKRMKKVSFQRIQPHLTTKEKVAQDLGSVKFEGWECLTCSQQLTRRRFHLIGLESNSSEFPFCPNCHEYTITRSYKTIEPATRSSEGIKRVMDKCNCCDYYQETEKIIPRLPPPSSSSGGGYSGGGYSGGGSSGGGSFGGGSSGGGGAGGSW
jgi:uncharacterized protein